MHRFVRLTAPAIFSLLIFANIGYGQPDSIYRIPAGTRIKLTLDADLSSGVASVNDTFIASISEPLKIRDVVMLPADTEIEGRVRGVSAASSGGKGGRLDLAFETIRLANGSRKIDGAMVTPLAEPRSTSFNMLSIIGGAIAGTAVGASGSTRGALIGAGLGAGLGSGVALVKKGREARIRKGEEFEIELKRDVVLPVTDY